MSGAASISARTLADGLAAGADGFVRMAADATTWEAVARGCAEGLQDFLSLWIDGTDAVMAVGVAEAGFRALLTLPLAGRTFPSVGQHHAPALRLERMIRDLDGAMPAGCPDERSWIDHGRWSGGAGKPYPFLPVDGEGLHQIPVGPVHAGIIEPGHFRFTANGEAVARLEERLGYVHKGTARLCRDAPLATAARLAARISGDATVAYSLAFALAAEAAAGIMVPPRATALRGIMAELERLAHHINDVGAICNDASVVVLQAHCTILREDILQTAMACFGHRLMMDRIVPGGVSCDLGPEGPAAILALLQRVETGFAPVVRVYDGAPSLQDRTVTTGIVRPEDARRFAAGGHVGRASGRAVDTRKSYAYGPYGGLALTPALRQDGDVDARVWIRIDEVASSIGLIRQLLATLPPGDVLSPWRAAAGAGVAMVESFRGDVLLALRLDAAGIVRQFHARDPSWFQWPLLETAIEGNIVADFPLCNKSFNCSYSGHDM